MDPTPGDYKNQFFGMYALVMMFVIVVALEATFKHIKYYEYYKNIW